MRFTFDVPICDRSRGPVAMWSFIIFIIDAIRRDLALASLFCRYWVTSDIPASLREDAWTGPRTSKVSNGGFISDLNRVLSVLYCINFSLSNAWARRPSHGYCTAMVTQVDGENSVSRNSTPQIEAAACSTPGVARGLNSTGLFPFQHRFLLQLPGRRNIPFRRRGRG
jgi:hypothetical protein